MTTQAPTLSAKLANTILLKREDLQPVFSFKIRGAHNKIASLSREQVARGIVACSAGNHAQGVALSATNLGIDAVIVMPNPDPDPNPNNLYPSPSPSPSPIAIPDPEQVIVMPTATPAIKVDGVRKFGGTVVLHGGNHDENP